MAANRQMQVKNTFQLGNGLSKSIGAVWARHDQFRLGTRKMRTPIGYHAVGTVRRIAATPIADDRVVRHSDWKLVEKAKDRGSRRKTVDAGRWTFQAEIPQPRNGDFFPSVTQDITGKANETDGDRTNPVTRKITAAMRDTDENDPFHMRVRIEDQRLFDQVVRCSCSVEPIRVVLEHSVP